MVLCRSHVVYLKRLYVYCMYMYEGPKVIVSSCSPCQLYPTHSFTPHFFALYPRTAAKARLVEMALPACHPLVPRWHLRGTRSIERRRGRGRTNIEVVEWRRGSDFFLSEIKNTGKGNYSPSQSGDERNHWNEASQSYVSSAPFLFPVNLTPLHRDRKKHPESKTWLEVTVISTTQHFMTK